MNLGLKNKVAVVAGSSKGLGFATAKLLLEEEANVVINGRNLDTLERALDSLPNNDHVSISIGDVTRYDDCGLIINQAIESFGKLDILITNCGGPNPGKFEDKSEEDWHEAIEKSLLSHVYLIKHGIPYLKQSDHASILTITSFTVKQPMPNMVLSNSIRAATIGLTKTLSSEFGVDNIRVNSILPGWTYTDRVKELLKDRCQMSGDNLEKEIAKITGNIPLGRMGTAEEFAKAAVFLVSPAASFINGVMLNVDGGINQGLF